MEVTGRQGRRHK